MIQARGFKASMTTSTLNMMMMIMIKNSHYKQPNALNSAADFPWKKQGHFYSAGMDVHLVFFFLQKVTIHTQECGTPLRNEVLTSGRLYLTYS